MQVFPDRRNRQNYIQRTGWQILLCVIVLHAILYLLWPQLKTMSKEELLPKGSLIFLRQPEQVKPSAVVLDTNESAQQKKIPSVARQVDVLNKAEKAGLEDKPPPVMSGEQMPADAGVDTAINRDTREIFDKLKKDFQYRDQVSSKAVLAPMEKLGASIKASSTVMREGYKHEVHILGDGRPVSKVITPYGTKCILHRKPGEIIGNEMATVPVTCGNL